MSQSCSRFDRTGSIGAPRCDLPMQANSVSPHPHPCSQQLISSAAHAWDSGSCCWAAAMSAVYPALVPPCIASLAPSPSHACPALPPLRALKSHLSHQPHPPSSLLCHQIKACDSILAHMEELLGKFQTDLGQVSDEIRQLQVQSQTMSTKLKNRRAAENKLGAFVEQMAVPEDLINSVLDAEVGGGERDRAAGGGDS